jgi:hypothetical protein
MIAALLGSDDAERVLLFLAAREHGYGREIAGFWDTSLYGIQRQLDKFEAGGIVLGTAVGRTRVYAWNPRWPFRDELQALLTKATSFLPDELQNRLHQDRRRPRRRGKPL